jgi:hypothetical protein
MIVVDQLKQCLAPVIGEKKKKELIKKKGIKI